MGFNIGLVTFVTLLFTSAVLSNEEAWDWSQPCIYYKPGQCSQQTSRGEIKCDIIKDDTESQCKDLGGPVRWTDIPDKPRNFTATWGTDFGVTADNVTENHITLNMSWSIDTFINHPIGFHVSIMGLTNHDQYEYDYPYITHCVTFDMTGNDYSVVDSRHLNYSFDCFRPLSPYCEYQLVVRTLPVTNETSGDGSIGPYSTQISHRFKVPSCGDHRISQTEECQVKEGEEAAYWQPAHLTPSSPTYEKIKAKFDIPPESYGIYEYTIYIYKYNTDTGSCSGYTYLTKINQDDLGVLLYNDTVDGHMYTFLEYILEKEFEGRHYCMKVTPGPDSACDTDTTDFCRTTTSDGFEVLDDPCNSEPCGDYGNCTGLHHEDYYECDCDPGYTAHPKTYPTCLVDSCYWEPCGGEGVGICIPVLNTTQYTCNCSSDSYAEDNTCKPDPCLSDPCGEYGTACKSWNSTYYLCNCTSGYYFDVTCQVDVCYGHECGDGHECIRLDGVYTCNCSSDQYAVKDGQCVIVKDTGVIVAAALGSILAVALLCFLALCYAKRMFNPLIRVPLKEGRYSDDVEGIANPRVLLLYAEDGDKHVDVVQHLASFLDCQLQCHIAFDYWDETNVAADKTEWIVNEIEKANKVVIIASIGTLQESDSSMFSYALKILQREQKFHSKCINVHFGIPGYSEEQHIPKVTKILAGKTFQLPEKLEPFYIHLRGLALGSPVGHRQVEGFQVMLNSTQNKNLQRSLQEMKSLVISNPCWYEASCKPTLDSNHVTLTDVANKCNGTVYLNGTYGQHSVPISSHENTQDYVIRLNGFPTTSLNNSSNLNDVSHTNGGVYMNQAYDPSDAPVPKKRSKKRKPLKMNLPGQQGQGNELELVRDGNTARANQTDTGYYSEDFSPSPEGENNLKLFPVSYGGNNETDTDDVHPDSGYVVADHGQSEAELSTEVALNQQKQCSPADVSPKVEANDEDALFDFALQLNMQGDKSSAYTTSDYSPYNGSSDPIYQQQPQNMDGIGPQFQLYPSSNLQNPTVNNEPDCPSQTANTSHHLYPSQQDQESKMTGASSQLQYQNYPSEIEHENQASIRTHDPSNQDKNLCL